MTSDQTYQEMNDFIREFVEILDTELKLRWESWQLAMEEIEKFEVLGGLLGRQVTLCTQIAQSPSIWNGHIAPILLRSMVDNYITIAWIFESPLERAQKFIAHGLGQEKLNFEHLKSKYDEMGVKFEENEHLQAYQRWIDSQKFHFLTTVDLGSWSGLTTRKMAEDSNNLDIYNHAYQPFSIATHSSWAHISRYNFTHCKSVLHRFHRIPANPKFSPDIDYLYRASKYLAKTFKLFDEKTKNNCQRPPISEKVEAFIETFGRESESKS